MADSVNGRVFAALVFSVRGKRYAFEQRGPATLLPWLQRYRSSSSAPGLPEWCLGLLNVRGAVQMVADLGHLLQEGRSEVAAGSRLIFIEHGTARLGLLVDEEIGVRYLRPGDPLAGQASPVFATGRAWLETEDVTVLDGAAIIQHVAEELRAPEYLA
ncbi:MAG: chemotaxis protein CheW [Chloroflexota bacterium]